LESSKERLLAWKNGKITAGERRILMTKWLGQSWEEYVKNHQATITNAFKRCGMYKGTDLYYGILSKVGRWW
jgi:hypothetical protein